MNRPNVVLFPLRQSGPDEGEVAAAHRAWLNDEVDMRFSDSTLIAAFFNSRDDVDEREAILQLLEARK